MFMLLHSTSLGENLQDTRSCHGWKSLLLMCSGPFPFCCQMKEWLNVCPARVVGRFRFAAEWKNDWMFVQPVELSLKRVPKEDVLSICKNFGFWTLIKKWNPLELKLHSWNGQIYSTLFRRVRVRAPRQRLVRVTRSSCRGPPARVTECWCQTAARISLFRTVLDRAPFDRVIVNPFHRKDGEFLPHKTFCNHQSLLVHGTVSFKIDEES